MTTFVIDLKNIQKDTSQLAQMLKDMNEKEVSEKGLIINFRLEDIIEQVENFYDSFLTTIFNHIEEDQSYWYAQEDDSFGGYVDAYGNFFYDLGKEYNYAEVTYNYITRFEKIRLLGVDNEGYKIRFMALNVENKVLGSRPNRFTFSQTTLNLIQNIKDINKPINYLDDFLSCNPQRKNKWGNDWEYIKKGFKDEPKNRYSWDQLSQLFFAPKPIYKTDEITDEQIRLLQKSMEENGPFTKEELDLFLINAQDKKQSIIDKADKKKEKSKTIGDKQRELQQSIQKSWTQWVDKYSVGCLIQEAIKCVVPKNLSCKQLLENLPPGQLYERLKAVFPSGDSLISEIDSIITDTIIGNKTLEIQSNIKDLQKWIKEDQLLLEKDTTTEEEKNNLNKAIEDKTTEIARLKQELEVEFQQKQEALAIQREQAEEYLEKGDIGVILKAVEGPNALSITNAILSAIDLIIPIEDLCQMIVDLISGNGIPKFELPDLRQPATDPLGGITFELNNAFLLAVQQAILSFLDGILSELINCDNLDDFIANAVGQTRGEGNQRTNPLQDLFTKDSDFFKEGGLIDRNYDRVIENLSKKSGNILEASVGNKKIPIGIGSEQFTSLLNPSGSITTLDTLKSIAQNVTSSFESAAISVSNATSLLSQKVKEAESVWDIDSTGTKFEVDVDTTILNLSEIDKFLESLERERALALQNSSDVTVRALNDAAGVQLLTEPVIQQESKIPGDIVLTPQERKQVKEELNNSFSSLIAVMPPSQLLSLLSGNSTQQTKKLAIEIFRTNNAPNLSALIQDDLSFVSLIESLGRLTGLDSMEDEVALLAQSPAFRENVQSSRCGNFSRVSDFRKALLSRVVQPDQAREIIEELDKKRIEKFNEMVQQILDMNEGKAPGNILDSNSALLEAVKAAKKGMDIKEAINSEKTRKTNNLFITNNNVTGISAGVRISAQSGSQSSNRTGSAQSLERSNLGLSIPDQIKSMKKTIESENPVLKQMFEIVTESLFDPIESSFYMDIKSISEAFSEIEEVDKIIERTLLVPVSRGSSQLSTAATQRNSTIDSVVPLQEVINPEFKKLVDSNLVPVMLYKNGELDPENQQYATMVDKSSLSYGDDGNIKKDNKSPEQNDLGYEISGDISTNYTKTSRTDKTKLPPIIEKVNKRIVGGSVSKNVNNYVFEQTITENELSFSISGSILNVSDSFIERVGLSRDIEKILNSSRPSWKISFDEKFITNQFYNDILLETNGYTITNRGKIENFFLPSFLVSKNKVSTESVGRLLQSKYGDNSYKKRKEVFDDIVIQEILKLVNLSDSNIRNRFSQDFKKESVKLYKSFIEKFVKNLSQNLSSPRLLQIAQTLKEGDNVTELELLDFISCDESDQLITILNFKRFREEFIEIYGEMPSFPLNIKQLRSMERRDTKISKTSKIILSSFYIRLICLDFIIKALPILDYFKFSKSIIGDFMLEIVSEYMFFELERNSTKNLNLIEFVESGAKDLYLYKNYQKVTNEQRQQNESNLSVETKKIINFHLEELMIECKKIVGINVETDETRSDQLILFILEQYTTIFLEQNRFSKLNKNEDVILEKFAYIPAFSKDVMDSPKFTGKGRFEILKAKTRDVVSIDEVRQFLAELRDFIVDEKITGFDNAFICNNINGADSARKAIFDSPIELGLRIVSYKKKEVANNYLRFNKNNYSYKSTKIVNYKLGEIREKIGQDRENYFDAFQLAEERIRVNKEQTLQEAANFFTKSTYDNAFYRILRDNLTQDQEVQLLFLYSLPIKEICNMFILHYYLSNNGEKMKNLLEPTKKKTAHMAEFAEMIGDGTKSADIIKKINKEQREEQENVGNPAGPLNEEALKLFYRTPIQILKSITIITDPNVAITDKIIRTVSALTPLLPPEARPPFIPYSAVSFALLPFPIFTPPPVGIIPPLTTYNPTSPMNYLFFALEPLLWDLPYFENYNKKSQSTSIEPCIDVENTEEVQE